jgi:hypothetical protein
MLYGNSFKITPESTPDATKQPEVMAKAADAGRLLGQRLTSGHNRKLVTQNMQQKMMAMLKSSA